MPGADEPGPGAAARRSFNELTDGPIARALLRLSGPMMVSALLQNAQSLIDLFWVGRLGPTSMAAVAMGGTVMMQLFPAVLGVAMGTLALVSRATGAGNDGEAGAAAAQSMLLALALGLVSGLVGWHVARPLLTLLVAGPAVLAEGTGYLRVLLAGSFTMNLLFIGNYGLQGAGDTRRPMVFMVVANAVNLTLDPLLIFGWGPFPRLGVVGAAWATVIAQAAAAGVSLRFLLGGKTRLRLHGAGWRPNPALMRRLLRIGLPGSGQMLSRSLMALVFMRLVAGFGTAAVAAYGTGWRLFMILLMPAFVLGGAASTMVGQNLGAGRPDRARHAAWVAAGMDVVLMASAAAALMTWAPHCIRLFNGEPEVVAAGTRYLRIVAPSFVFAALAIVLGRGLAGAGDTLWPMFITILSLWGLQVPLAWWWSRPPGGSLDGIWRAMAIAMSVHGLLVTAWFETGRWKRHTV